MAKDLLKKQLDDIQESITETLSIVRRLLDQAESVSKLIESLSKKEGNDDLVKNLNDIKKALDVNINDLVSSLGKLFDEYQEFLKSSL